MEAKRVCGQSGLLCDENLLKRCSACREEKPLSHFSRSRRRADGIDGNCRQCNAHRQRAKKARYITAGLCIDCAAPRQSNKRYCDPCASVYSTTKRRRHQGLRMRALTTYAAHELKCACCGETRVEFLTLDHVNNDGNAHRQQCGSTYGTYWHLKRNSFPPIMQVLCFNCNMARAAIGVCPHRGSPEIGAPNELRPVNNLQEGTGLKQCSKCGMLLPRGCFYRDPGTRDLLQSRCGACTREAARDRLVRIKREALMHYSHTGRLQCACCGEAEVNFLVLDHVNGGGTRERRTAGQSGAPYYAWLKRRGFPAGLEVATIAIAPRGTTASALTSSKESNWR